MGWNCCVRTRTLYRTTIKMPKNGRQRAKKKILSAKYTTTKTTAAAAKIYDGKENRMMGKRKTVLNGQEPEASEWIIMQPNRFQSWMTSIFVAENTLHTHTASTRAMYNCSWHLSMWLYIYIWIRILATLFVYVSFFLSFQLSRSLVLSTYLPKCIAKMQNSIA